MSSGPMLPAHEERLRTYLEEVYRWNGRVNLTAVPPEEAWERHVGDSLRLLAAVPPPPSARVVDVGSGLGIPGLPLAVLRPDLEVTLVEADSRRAGFLTHAAGLLHLTGVRVRAARAEQVGHEPGFREVFDLAVSRGTAPAAVLCELALPLVVPGGRLAALVTDAAEAAAGCAAAARVCGGGLPHAAAPGVLCVPKLAPTPPAYPRRAGLPARRPLSASA